MTQHGIRPLQPEFIDGKAIEARMRRFEKEVRDAEDTAHRWVFTILHRLTEDQARTARGGQIMAGILDHESLVLAGGPICYRCEIETYTTEPCTGYREVVRA